MFRAIPILYVLTFVATAEAREYALSLAYGPTRQLIATAGLGAWSVYGQPFLSYSAFESSDGWETGARWGAMYSHTALAWRQLEVRAQAGAGLHYAYRRQTYTSAAAGPDYTRFSTQEGVEVWLQPEFRFQTRFALLLEAAFLRYLRTEDSDGFKEESAGFVTPELSLNRLGFGLRYYLVFGKP